MIKLEPMIYTGFGVVLGFVLGFLGTLLTEFFKRRRSKKDFKEGLCAQLREVQPRLAGIYGSLSIALGKIDRDMLSWVHSMKLEWSGDPLEITQTKIEELLKLGNDELAKATQLLIATQSGRKVKYIKKISLPFLENNFHLIPLLDSNHQRFILDIWTKINWLKEEIDRCNFFFERTFDSSLSPENWEILHKNINKSYEVIAKLCRDIAESVSKIIEELSK